MAPLHDVVRLAEEWSLVDNLSRGRVGLAFASGWHAGDFVFFPARYLRRRSLPLGPALRWGLLDAAGREHLAGRIVLPHFESGSSRWMIGRLLAASPENTLLFDEAIEPGDEPVKICLSGTTIVDFAKLPEHAHERHGESVGFFRFSPGMAAGR